MKQKNKTRRVFHQWQTEWSKEKKKWKSRGIMSPFDLAQCAFKAHTNGTETLAMRQMGMVARINRECLWYSLGKPYYQLTPEYQDQLLKSKAPIPCEAFRAPYEVFAIQFPETEGSGDCQAMLVAVDSVDKPKKLIVWVQCDNSFSFMPRYSHIDLSRADTVDQCIENVASREGDTEFPGMIKEPLGARKERAFRDIKLAVMVSLLAVSMHRDFDHDVLEKLREKYDDPNTDEKTRQRIEQKSIRRGKNGKIIGDGRRLELTTSHTEQDSQSNGRELSHGHIRGAHFHTYWVGSGDCRVREVKYIGNIRVRKDLPLPPAT